MEQLLVKNNEYSDLSESIMKLLHELEVFAPGEKLMELEEMYNRQEQLMYDQGYKDGQAIGDKRADTK